MRKLREQLTSVTTADVFSGLIGWNFAAHAAFRDSFYSFVLKNPDWYNSSCGFQYARTKKLATAPPLWQLKSIKSRVFGEAKGSFLSLVDGLVDEYAGSLF